MNILQRGLVMPSDGQECGANWRLKIVHLSGCLVEHLADRIDPGILREWAPTSVVPGKGQFDIRTLLFDSSASCLPESGRQDFMKSCEGSSAYEDFIISQRVELNQCEIRILFHRLHRIATI